ncbi:MAG: hypothetical protein KDA61_05640, partial [Planctomycetales bacterium]|nr:hypothetical protein [Planctomycetales bacterium]
MPEGCRAFVVGSDSGVEDEGDAAAEAVGPGVERLAWPREPVANAALAADGAAAAGAAAAGGRRAGGATGVGSAGVVSARVGPMGGGAFGNAEASLTTGKELAGGVAGIASGSATCGFTSRCSA